MKHNATQEAALGTLSAKVGGRLAPAPSAPVHRYEAVHGNRHEFAVHAIHKLDDLMPAPGKLTTTARLIRLLLNRCVMGSPHGEGCGPETLLAGAADGEPLAADLDLVGAHHLPGNGA